LVNQLIDDILIIKKRKNNIRNFGKANIRWKNLYYYQRYY
jgi:hypothetical protein